MGLRAANIRIKSNSHYTCQECGSIEQIQAHHQIPHDDNSLIVLCASCHSKKHPNVPLGLFFSNTIQPYWQNISAASLARQCYVNSRTICRRAKALHIEKGILSKIDEDRIRKYNVRYLFSINKQVDDAVGNIDIREVRRRLDMSQETIARGIGVSPCIIRKWESGRYRPSAFAIVAVESFIEKQKRNERSPIMLWLKREGIYK